MLSHELTASVDAATFLLSCMAFPLIALGLTGLAALSLWDTTTGRAARGEVAAARQAPEPTPDPPDGSRLVSITDDDAGLAADLPAFTNEAQASRTSSWPAWLTLPPSLPSESHSTARRARNLPARRAVLPVTG